MAELGEEELDVLVGKLPELVAQDIVNAYMVGVSSAFPVALVRRPTDHLEL